MKLTASTAIDNHESCWVAARVLAERTVAAIGPITAATAREAGIRVDVGADEFTVEGLLRVLAATAV